MTRQRDACDAVLAELAKHPDDAGTQRIYADALSERGDPRGELIALELALAATALGAATDLAARVVALRELVDAAVMQRVDGALRPRLRWRHGFVHAVELDYNGDEPFDVLARLAGEPALRLVRRIAISATAMDGRDDCAPLIAELARLAPAFPCVVELEVTEGPDFGNPWIDGPVAIDDVTPVLHAFPRLERLVIEGDPVRFGPADMTALHTLHVAHLDRDGAATLAAVRAPVLDDLAIWFRSQPADSLVAALDAVLAAGFAPTALSLAVQSPAMAEVIARVSAASLAERVRRLGLGGRLDDAAVAALVARRERWPQLVELRIAERACTAAARERIARAFGVPIVEP
jgi:uncharacterized protein (TIGR02996 family)